MFTYTEPSFDFKAPRAFATRADQSVPNNLEYRTEFMRDRDRILYCNSFRRLAGKTQIYRTGIDDHRRNRLSHTLEVSQIARTIAKALKLNEDLTEAIALGHDLGHTPFGHAGEQILHEIMVPNSKVNIKDSPMQLPIVADTTRASDLQTKFLFGFKHNLQSVRVVATLEDGYGDCGLNLTNFTLWGIEHHSSLCYKAGRVLVEGKYLEPNYKEIYKNRLYLKGSVSNEAWSFEASVVAIADEIAQWHHDLEDALRSGAMSPKEVCELIKDSLLRNQENFEEEHEKLDRIEKHHQVTKSDLTILSQIVINFFVNRIIECSIANLELLQKDLDEKGETFKDFLCKHAYTEAKIKNAISLNKIEGNKEDMAKAGTAFAEAISEKIHHSSEVERMNAKGQYIVKKLFQAYYAHPQQLPDNIVIHYVVEARKHIESLRLDISNNDKLQSIGAFTTLEVARSAGIGAVRLGLAKMMENQDAFDPYNKILLMRFICDHIANMTDHYAIQEYSLLYA